jgi:hypothetical protein
MDNAIEPEVPLDINGECTETEAEEPVEPT